MKIEDVHTAHLLFEQSGTYKKAFLELGIPAYDYDIQNEYGQTDHVIDLFAEIEKEYEGGISVFQHFSKDDIIMAFFPCIYFTGFTNPLYFALENLNYKNMTTPQKFDAILEREKHRHEFYCLLYKLCAICYARGLRMIFENPFSTLHFLHNNFLKEPDILDTDRTLRGDYYKKPTGYWFFNCEPTHGFTPTRPKERRIVMQASGSGKAGICSKERSEMSPEYARNFLNDFLFHDDKQEKQLSLF